MTRSSTPPAAALGPQASPRRVLVAGSTTEETRALLALLAEAGLQGLSAPSGSAAIALLGHARVDLLLCATVLPDGDGLDLLQQMALLDAAPPALLLCDQVDAATALRALRAGVRDVLVRPVDVVALLQVIHRHAGGRTAPCRPASGEPPVASPGGLIANDAAMRAIVDRVERAARSDATVLLTGESGVGKEVMARHLHLCSRRADGPFVAINCAAIPDTLLESTLFGVERGAFTGANRSQAGKFEQAQHGTLFLDEVGELPFAMQAKLLRALQERSVERVGGGQPVTVDIRLVAATNRDLQQAVAEGRFREDLYYRLAVFPVTLPPLRERPGDILSLAEAFVQRYARDFGMPPVTLNADAEAALVAYRWPGNVRELENVVQRALLMCDSSAIRPVDLELPAPSRAPASGPPAVATAAPAAPAATRVPVAAGQPRNVRDVEREHILHVLAQVQGNRRAAIGILGISERALRYKLKAYRDQGALISDHPVFSAEAP